MSEKRLMNMKANLDFDTRGKATVTLIMSKDELKVVDSALKAGRNPYDAPFVKNMVHVVDKARNDLWGSS